MSELLIGFLFYVSLTVFTSLLVVINRRLIYWRQRGITHNRPKLIFGNLLGWHGGQSLNEILTEIYKQYKSICDPFCGVYFFTEPVALILNKDLAVKVLTEDFKNFSITAPIVENDSPSSYEIDFNILKRNFDLEKIGDVLDVHKASLRCVSEVFGYWKSLQKFRRNKFSYAFEKSFPKFFRNEENIKKLAIQCEVSSMLLTQALFELAKNPELQEKLFTEALKMLDKYENRLEKESFEDFSLLNNFITEIWQQQNPFPHLLLRALENYKTHRSGFDIEKGQLVVIPVEAMDSKDSTLTLLAFGNCGIQLQVILVLEFLLNHYKFLTCDTTIDKITLRETLPHRTLRGAIELRVMNR